jgi:type II secretory pathway pseudopilin PulG
MRTSERGSSLVIASIVVVVVAVIGIGLLRYASREVAGASAGQRAEALSTCTEAARQLLQSRFHALGTNPTQIAVLSERLDGNAGSFRALGGHIDSNPTGVLVTVDQVAPLPTQAIGTDAVNLDVTNTLSGAGGAGGPAGTLGGTPLKVTVHCQEGDLTSWTSGRQLEIEFGIRFGL